MNDMPPLPSIDGVRICHIQGQPGYAIGDDGSAWSCKQMGKQKYGTWFRLKPRPIKRTKHLKVWLLTNGVGTNPSVHTLVLEHFVGPRPPGMVARHFPDRDPSNNHWTNLQWGTHKENTQDAKVHGTHRNPPPMFGENHSTAKRLDEEVVEIHKMAASKTMLLGDIAKRFGVCAAVVTGIIQGKTWQHLGLPPLDIDFKSVAAAGSKNPAAKLTEDQVVEIRGLYAAGHTQVALAKQFGVSQALISRIKRGVNWNGQKC